MRKSPRLLPDPRAPAARCKSEQGSLEQPHIGLGDVYEEEVGQALVEADDRWRSRDECHR